MRYHCSDNEIHPFRFTHARAVYDAESHQIKYKTRQDSVFPLTRRSFSERDEVASLLFQLTVVTTREGSIDVKENMKEG